MLRTAVIGAGSLGRQHARIHADLAAEGTSQFVAVCDINEQTARAISSERETDWTTNWRDLIGRIDAASLAVPTEAHCEIACGLLEAGIHVLVEKPISRTLEEADRMIEAAARGNAILQVGHLERFNPAVQATLPLITKPMFFEVHRLSVFTPRSLDVDVVLDLMIHDLDAVLAFVQSPVKEIRAAGLPILSNKVDIANARIEFESGCIANFTASRVSTERVRKLRFFQPRQYISIDYGRQDVLVFSVGEGGGAPSPNPNIKISKPAVIAEEPLRAEIRGFLHAVRTRKASAPDLEDGRRALEVALEILTQIEAHAGKLGLLQSNTV